MISPHWSTSANRVSVRVWYQGYDWLPWKYLKLVPTRKTSSVRLSQGTKTMAAAANKVCTQMRARINLWQNQPVNEYYLTC